MVNGGMKEEKKESWGVKTPLLWGLYGERIGSRSQGSPSSTTSTHTYCSGPWGSCHWHRVSQARAHWYWWDFSPPTLNSFLLLYKQHLLTSKSPTRFPCTTPIIHLPISSWWKIAKNLRRLSIRLENSGVGVEYNWGLSGDWSSKGWRYDFRLWSSQCLFMETSVWKCIWDMIR